MINKTKAKEKLRKLLAQKRDLRDKPLTESIEQFIDQLIDEIADGIDCEERDEEDQTKDYHGLTGENAGYNKIIQKNIEYRKQLKS